MYMYSYCIYYGAGFISTGCSQERGGGQAEETARTDQKAGIDRMCMSILYIMYHHIKERERERERKRKRKRERTTCLYYRDTVTCTSC